MDLSVMKSPWVIGAGLVLGLLVLARNQGGSGESTSDYVMAMNSQGQAAIQAQSEVAVAKTNANAGLMASFMANLSNMQQAADATRMGIVTSQNGVEIARINAMSSYLIEQSDNSARLGTAYIAGDVANRQTYSQERIAQIQANAAVTIAKKQRDASMFGAAVGSISNIVGAGLKFLA